MLFGIKFTFFFHQIIVFSIIFVVNCATGGAGYEFDEHHDEHEQADDAETLDEPPLPTTHTSIHKTIVKHVKVSHFYQ